MTIRVKAFRRVVPAILLAVLAGCKSAPVQYEMIEVANVQTMQDLYGSTRKGRARQMPKVPVIKRSWDQCRDDPSDARRADSQACKALLGSDQVFHALRD
jgi:hypothetical protein